MTKQAQYNAEELLSKREQISEQIRVNLMARAREFHLILDGAARADGCVFDKCTHGGVCTHPDGPSTPHTPHAIQTCPSRT